MVSTQEHSRKSKSPQSPNGKWRMDIIKDAAEGRRLIDSTIATMASARYSKRDQFAVELAMEEAIANALKHGNQSDPDKRVTVLVRVDEAHIVAEVEDEGPGFNPASVPDPLVHPHDCRPSGRGLLLMYRYMSWVRYSRRGNRVTLCRHRSM